MDKFFQQAAWRLYDYCEHPAVRYKILFHLLDRPYDDGELCRLRPAFLASENFIRNRTNTAAGAGCKARIMPQKTGFPPR